MKRKVQSLVAALLLAFSATSLNAQTTAMNYNFIDCAGNPQSIFADLDAGKALIIEFFMTSCSPCITAGATLEAMKADLMTEFPGMIKAYAFGFSDTYNCATINSWVTTNGITSIPADSGALQVAYYGGMGMPTIVILGGGTAHSVLGSPYLSFTTGDTATMANDIRNFLNGTGVEENSLVSNLNTFPNPGNEIMNLEFVLSAKAAVKIELFDLSGRLVQIIADKKDQVGKMREVINTAALSNGSYILKVSASGIVSQRKFNVVH